MVKHQDRSHQPGTPDFLSDSNGGSSLLTPIHPVLTWIPPPYLASDMDGHPFHRTSLHSNLGQYMSGFDVQAPYGPQSGSLIGVHGGYYDIPNSEHVDAHTPQRTTNMPHHPFYATEQGNPRVAVTSTNPIGALQVLQQQPDELVASFFSGNQSNTFSPNPGVRSAPSHEGYYYYQQASHNGQLLMLLR